MTQTEILRIKHEDALTLAKRFEEVQHNEESTEEIKSGAKLCAEYWRGYADAIESIINDNDIYKQ